MVMYLRTVRYRMSSQQLYAPMLHKIASLQGICTSTVTESRPPLRDGVTRPLAQIVQVLERDRSAKYI